MMEHNWENFLKNLGEWQGSFTTVSLQGELLDSTPSILNLDAFEDNRLVKFRLRRYGPGGYQDAPASDVHQDYRSVGRQVIFFDTGAFSKGNLQVAPFSVFGAEYGFVTQDRRLRFVQLYDQQGSLSSQILIREFRTGSSAQERPPLSVDQLVGQWRGEATSVYADWQPSNVYQTQLDVNERGGQLQQQLSFGSHTLTSTAQIEGQKLMFTDSGTPRQLLLLADGVSSNTPFQISHRQPFFVELGWLVGPNQRQRLIRNYNEKGEWVSATHVIEHRVG
jgi:hypothetical protein